MKARVLDTKKKKVNKTAENQRKQKILNVIRQKKITF